MRLVFGFLAAALVLVACGVDGEPERPTTRATGTAPAGLSITGTAVFGIVGSN